MAVPDVFPIFFQLYFMRRRPCNNLAKLGWRQAAFEYAKIADGDDRRVFCVVCVEVWRPVVVNVHFYRYTVKLIHH